MNGNYAEIWRQIFNKFCLLNFSEIVTILLWNINSLNSAKKNNNYFLDKSYKKSFYYRNCIGQMNFWP